MRCCSTPPRRRGTALNLFLLDVPRLSVDVNYIGSEQRDVMLAKRPRIEAAVVAVLKREGFQVRRMPQEHAVGKWRLRFPSALGQEGSLELDVNFMFRVPLWPWSTRTSSSRVGFDRRRLRVAFVLRRDQP